LAGGIAHQGGVHGRSVIGRGGRDRLCDRSRPRRRLIEALKTGIPVGRLGEPRDVLAAVSFFSTPQAEYITGQTLSVNGGLSMV
jgi:NAD(P)-dependent dehydrogenase (short-subunit alcohol dehydrogenase family)